MCTRFDCFLTRAFMGPCYLLTIGAVVLIGWLLKIRFDSELGVRDWFWSTAGPLVEILQPQLYSFDLDIGPLTGAVIVGPHLAAALKREREAARHNVESCFSQEMRDAGRYVSAYDVHMPSRDSKRLIVATVTTPPIGNKTAGLPLIFFFHGGWLVYGDRVSELAVTRLIAQQLPAVVVSVEYRLAPEHPFPAAMHDCEDLVDAVLEKDGALGPTMFNRSQVFAMGFGAGGYLASLVALSLAERNISIAGHLSVAPMLSPIQNSSSHSRYASVPYHGGRMAAWAWSAYLQGVPPERWDWRASPLLAADAHLAACSPGAVVLHTFDALHDEGKWHARRLEANGRLAKIVELPLPHVTTDGFELEMLQVMELLRLLASRER